MLEEELYEPMRMWLEQYMIDNYKGLAANLFLMFLLFRFMVNRQLWDK